MFCLLCVVYQWIFTHFVIRLCYKYEDLIYGYNATLTCCNIHLIHGYFCFCFFLLFIDVHSDLSTRETELQKLTTEVTRTKDVEKLYTVQKYDLEQLKLQLADQEKSNHAEEKNKIEIRNLQNALDSSKKELEAQRAQAQDFKLKSEELSKQMVESRLLTNTKQTEDSFLVSK